MNWDWNTVSALAGTASAIGSFVTAWVTRDSFIKSLAYQSKERKLNELQNTKNLLGLFYLDILAFEKSIRIIEGYFNPKTSKDASVEFGDKSFVTSTPLQVQESLFQFSLFESLIKELTNTQLPNNLTFEIYSFYRDLSKLKIESTHFFNRISNEQKDLNLIAIGEETKNSWYMKWQSMNLQTVINLQNLIIKCGSISNSIITQNEIIINEIRKLENPKSRIVNKGKINK